MTADTSERPVVQAPVKEATQKTLLASLTTRINNYKNEQQRVAAQRSTETGEDYVERIEIHVMLRVYFASSRPSIKAVFTECGRDWIAVIEMVPSGHNAEVLDPDGEQLIRIEAIEGIKIIHMT